MGTDPICRSPNLVAEWSTGGNIGDITAGVYREISDVAVGRIWKCTADIRWWTMLVAQDLL